MPVHRKKKDTTTNTPGSTQEQTAPLVPDQQEFHQHLRELALSGMRIVLEVVFCASRDPVALHHSGSSRHLGRRSGEQSGN